MGARVPPTGEVIVFLCQHHGVSLRHATESHVFGREESDPPVLQGGRGRVNPSPVPPTQEPLERLRTVTVAVCAGVSDACSQAQADVLLHVRPIAVQPRVMTPHYCVPSCTCSSSPLFAAFGVPSFPSGNGIAFGGIFGRAAELLCSGATRACVLMTDGLISARVGRFVVGIGPGACAVDVFPGVAAPFPSHEES